jgi:hypothetical protein
MVPSPRDEARCRSVGQPGEDADIEADHLIHLLDVRMEEGAVAGIPALFTSSVMPAFVRRVVSPKLGGAKVIPQGAARRLPETNSLMKLPFSSKIATAPAPNGASIWLARPTGA